MSADPADFPIAAMARGLGVATAGHHAWADRQPSARRPGAAEPPQRVRTVRLGSR